MATQYTSNDDKSFWEIADNHLIRYRGEFPKLIIVRAAGSRIYDASGKSILDFTSGQMSSVLGHAHPEIRQVLSDAFNQIDHTFSTFLTPPVIQLASMLTAKLPPTLDRCMFLSTGGESNEAAIKMAKIYTGKFEVVGLLQSWHGQTQAASACTYQTGRGPGPQIGQFALVNLKTFLKGSADLVKPAPNPYRSIFRKADGSHDWQAELDYGWDLIDRQSVGSLACCIIEPILSSGGVIVLPDGYIRALKKKCEEREMLLIIDEAQTGVYRTGPFCAFQRTDVVPDILTLSKTLGAGLPLSATITSTAIEKKCFENGFSFLTTHVSDPAVAAVSCKVLEIMDRDNLGKRAEILGERFRERLRKLSEKYECIGDVRGQGLMIGLELVQDRKTKVADAEIGTALGAKLLELGLNANVVAGGAANSCFRIAPPLNVSDEEIEEALQKFEEAFSTVQGTKPLQN